MPDNPAAVSSTPRVDRLLSEIGAQPQDQSSATPRVDRLLREADTPSSTPRVDRLLSELETPPPATAQPGPQIDQFQTSLARAPYSFEPEIARRERKAGDETSVGEKLGAAAKHGLYGTVPGLIHQLGATPPAPADTELTVKKALGETVRGMAAASPISKLGKFLGVPPTPPKLPEGLGYRALSDVISIGADPTTPISFGLGGQAGRMAAKPLVKRAVAKYGKKALPTQAVARGAKMAGGLPAFTAARNPFEQALATGEVSPAEYGKELAKSAVVGAAAGGAGAVPRVGLGLEIGAFAGVGAGLEGRMPTWEDLAHSAGVIGGLKTAGAATRVGKAMWKRAAGRKLTGAEEAAYERLTPEQREQITQQAVAESRGRELKKFLGPIMPWVDEPGVDLSKAAFNPGSIERAGVERFQEKRRRTGADPKQAEPEGMELTDGVRDYHIARGLGTWVNQLRALGYDATQIVNDMLGTEARMARETYQLRESMHKALDRLSPRLSAEGGVAAWDILEGRAAGDIAALKDVRPADRQALIDIRNLTESWKHEIILPRLRGGVIKLWGGRPNDRIAEALGPEGLREAGLGVEQKVVGERTVTGFTDLVTGKSVPKQKALEALARGQVPDDWGPYGWLPQLHIGSFRLFRIRNGNREFLGRFETKWDAKIRIAEEAEKDPSLGKESFLVEKQLFGAPEILRVSGKRRFKILSDMAKAADVSLEEVQDATRGIIGAREAKQKFFGSLRKRKGSPGYRKDLRWAFDRYLRGLVRWKELSDLNRRVRPQIDALRSKGMINAAAKLEWGMDRMWGVQTDTSRGFDALIESTPGLRMLHKPFALERWLGRVRGGTARAMLTTLRFHGIVNPTQLLETLYPLVNSRTMLRGAKLFTSREGWDLLDRHGVLDEMPTRFEDIRTLSAEGRARKVREFAARWTPFASETRNQAFTWLTIFDRGLELGFPEAQAAEYARLYQNVSQFKRSVIDQMGYSKGEVGRTVTQFKRFPTKNIELLLNRVKARDYPAVARWTAVHLLFAGPLRVLKLAAPFAAYSAYQAIKQDYGESVANLTFHGLFSTTGLDVGGSYSLVDAPYGRSIPERIGNVAMPPMGSVALGIGRAVGDVGGAEYTTAPQRAWRAAVQRLPALRPVEALGVLLDDDSYFTDPAGRIRFEADFKDIVVKLAGGRTTKEAMASFEISALYDIMEERNRKISVLSQKRNSDRDEWYEDMLRWNDLFPEFPITPREVAGRARGRRREAGLTRTERVLRGAPKRVRRGMESIGENPFETTERRLQPIGTPP